MTRLRRLVAPALARCAGRFGRRDAATRARGEDGFTMVELMVASGVMLAAVTAMLYTTFAGLKGIAVARQRQTANGLANQALEQIRALPFDTVERGLSNTDLSSTTDSRITHTGSGSSAVYSYGGEQIPRGDNVTAVPLVPHQQSFVRNNLTYKVSAYVTYFNNDTTSNSFRATVIVNWPMNGSVTGAVQAQTVVYSPLGCQSAATHPFSAPCQPFLYGLASNAAGSVNVTGSISSLSLDHATLWLPGQSSNTQIEQVQAVQGTAQTSGISLQLTGQTEQTAGRQSVSSGADDDRSQSKPDYQTASTGVQSSSSFNSTVNNNSITVSDDAGDSAATTSTISASATHPCPLLLPTSSFDLTQNDTAPCGSSKAQQGGALAAAMNLRAGPTDLTTTLFSLGAPSAPSGAFTNRDTAPEPTVCTQTLGTQTPDPGCIQSLQYRSRGTVTLLKLPSALPLADIPIGYDSTKGLIQLTGFSDSVSAEAGLGSAPPNVNVTGTVAYFNGLGYTTITLGPGGPVSIPLGGGSGSGNGIHISDSALNGAPLTIDIGSNLTTGGTSTTDSGTVTCATSTGTGQCRSLGSATSKSPITGTINYQVSYAGSVVANLNMTVDLGTLLAKSSYTAAPNGT